MIKKLLWQLREFKAPFPAMDSWAYAFHCWLYDYSFKRHAEPIEHTLELTGFDSVDNIKIEHSSLVSGPQIYTVAILLAQLRRVSDDLKASGMLVTSITLKYRERDNELYHELLKESADSPAFTGTDDDNSSGIPRHGVVLSEGIIGQCGCALCTSLRTGDRRSS